MIAPIAIVVPAYGEPGNPYAAFGRRWMDAVARMDPAPAEIVVAHSIPEPLGLLDLGVPVTAIPVVGAGLRVEDYCSAGVAAAIQPWVSCVGVDDVLQADALADLAAADAVGAEVMLWDHHDGEQRRRGRWSPYAMLRDNLVHGSCPFRRSLWRRVGGFPRVAWADWGFWLRCAAADAIVHRSDRVGVLWDRGEGRDTFTQQAADPAVLHRRNAEIRRFVFEEILS